MGCIVSTPAKVQPYSYAKKDTKQVSKSTNTGKSSTRVEKSDPNKDYFNQLTDQVNTMKCPPGMSPVVCLNKDSFPVVLSELYLSDEEVVEIQLPIVAASSSDKGRVGCISHIYFLVDTIFLAEDNSIMFYNMMSWLARKNILNTRVLLIGKGATFKESIHSCFLTQGISAHVGTMDSDFSPYAVVVIASDTDLSINRYDQKLRDYVKNGGGLLCLYAPPIDENNQETIMNPFLMEYGLAFSLCVLNPHSSSRNIVSISSCYEMVSYCHLIPMAEDFKYLASQTDLDTAQLDDLVTALRYHVIVCGPNQYDILSDILDQAYNHLVNTGYRTEQGLCPLLSHCIMSTLIPDLVSKLPAKYIKASPDAEDFPGLCPNATVENHELEVRLHEESWISTGLWLPAGSLGEIISDPEDKSIFSIQIGSHTESLLSRQGPWKRWPVVSKTYDIDPSGKTEIASPFGGIVYITIRELNEETDNRVKLKFNGFVRHPRAVIRKPEIWESSKDYQVPWGEMCSKTVIFTLPSDEIRKITDIDKVLEHVDKVVTHVLEFMNASMNRPYRVVFDTQLPGDKTESEYPIVLDIKDLDDIINNYNKPTVAMFELIARVSLLSIREAYFDNLVETAISNLVACIIFNEFFPGFDPNIFKDYNFPPLFAELWVLHQHINQGLIKDLLALSQAPEAPYFDSDEDMWTQFVKDVSVIGKYNFTKLLERVRPIPLNLSKTLAELPNPPIRVCN